MDLEQLKKFKSQILELAEANKALNIRVFGSVSREGGAAEKCGNDRITAPNNVNQIDEMPSLWSSQDT